MSKELGLSGSITLYAEGILEDNFEVLNEPWATVTVEYNIVFQGKTSNSLTGVYDGSGNLIGVTINAIDAAANLPLTGETIVTGSLDQDTKVDIDASGNLVETRVNDMGVPLL